MTSKKKYKLSSVKSVKWGGIIYEIKLHKNMVEHHGPVGFVSHERKEIVADKEVDLVGTFIHENIHCAENFLCESTDEERTERITTAIRAFFADNSKAVRALLDEIDKEVAKH